MKKILFIFSYLVMITCALLINQACQENYEMVDPPLITGTDDLDEEVIIPEDLECYYVSPSGKGNLDGSSWDNAMSADYFRDLLSASSNADITNEKAERLDGKNLYLAAGEYELVKNDAGIKMDYTSYNSSVDIYIEGGYDPESTGGDLSKRDTKRFITSLTRNTDSNAGKTTNSVFQLGNQMNLYFNGCVFDGKYDKETDGAVRAFYSNGINTSLYLTDCVIKNFNVENAVTTRGGAIFINRGEVFMNNVEIYNNIAGDRGGALMVANGNCQLFMNACTLYENYVTGQWSTAIHTGGKAIMCMNNTTIWGAAGNDDRNIVVNGDGYFLFANTTIIGNEKNNYGVLRSPSYSAVLVNSLFSKGKGTRTIYLDKSSYLSKGYNVYQAADQGWGATEKDTDYSDVQMPEPELTDGVYQWNVSEEKIKNFATIQEVIDVVRDFTVDDKAIGVNFLEWCGESAFSIDGRGKSRNVEKMQAGAYDAGL